MTRRRPGLLAWLVLATAALGAASCASTPAADGVTVEPEVPAGPVLRVVDTRNTTVTVRGASIDYGGLFADAETTGIRGELGEGLVTIKWADVESVTLVPKSGAAPQADVVLRNGQRTSATLIRKGRMLLTGRTDLGSYSIALEKVRTITPIQAPAGAR